MRRLFLALLSVQLALGMTCPPKASAQPVQQVDVINALTKMNSQCPTIDSFITCWYAPSATCSKVLADWNAQIPFGANGYIEYMDGCLDKATEKEWCGCKGVRCLCERANKRLSVILTGSGSWRIKLMTPIPLANISTGNSSCHPYSIKYIPTPSKTAFKVPNMANVITFDVPTMGTMGKFCMWEIKMGNDIYHEHFVANDNCYAWIEVKVNRVKFYKKGTPKNP
jgi:hypothetical protein